MKNFIIKLLVSVFVLLVVYPLIVMLVIVLMPFGIVKAIIKHQNTTDFTDYKRLRELGIKINTKEF